MTVIYNPGQRGQPRVVGTMVTETRSGISWSRRAQRLESVRDRIKVRRDPDGATSYIRPLGRGAGFSSSPSYFPGGWIFHRLSTLRSPGVRLAHSGAFSFPVLGVGSRHMIPWGVLPEVGCSEVDFQHVRSVIAVVNVFGYGEILQPGKEV